MKFFFNARTVFIQFKITHSQIQTHIHFHHIRVSERERDREIKSEIKKYLHDNHITPQEKETNKTTTHIWDWWFCALCFTSFDWRSCLFLRVRVRVFVYVKMIIRIKNLALCNSSQSFWLVNSGNLIHSNRRCYYCGCWSRRRRCCCCCRINRG